MADYKKMYTTLFNAQTDAIGILQKAQQITEEMFMDAPDTNIRVVEPGKAGGSGPDDLNGARKD